MLKVPFTQFVRPNGRRRELSIWRPDDIKELARRFIEAGGWFECEELSTGQVSLTACKEVQGEPQDIEIEVGPNGPAVLDAVDRLVRKAAKHLPGGNPS